MFRVVEGYFQNLHNKVPANSSLKTHSLTPHHKEYKFSNALLHQNTFHILHQAQTQTSLAMDLSANSPVKLSFHSLYPHPFLS